MRKQTQNGHAAMNNNDLDAQVAEQVMGWHRLQQTDVGIWWNKDKQQEALISEWHPSTSWADAGRVLEHTNMVKVWCIYQIFINGRWLWAIDRDHTETDAPYVAKAPTGPETICRAALVWAQEQRS